MMLRTCLVSSVWRSRRLRRVLRGVLAVVLPLILLWVGLDLYWSVELRVKLNALRASGQPLTFAAMMPADVPDSQNAAAAYRDWLRLPYPKVYTDAEDYVRKNDRAHELAAGRYLATPEIKARLALAERVSVMPECVWLERLEPEKNSVLCGRTRAFLNLAALQSAWLGRHGQADEALHWCAVGVRMAQQAGRYPQDIGLLVERADLAITLQPAQEVIAGNRASAAGRGELDAALGAVDLNQTMATAVRGEIAAHLDRFEKVRSSGAPRVDPQIADLADYWLGRAGLPSLDSAFWWLRYSRLRRLWASRDECAWLDLIGAEQAAVALPSPQAKAALAAVRAKLPSRWLAPSTVLSYGDQDQSVASRRDEGIANVDLCRITLALQGYREAHGRYPETLEALGASEPGLRLTDPFSGKSYVYRREGPGFLVYSFGPDLKDDGGKPLVYPLPQVMPPGPGGASKKGPAEAQPATSGGASFPTGDIVWRCEL
jgi:hypothetical protein